MSTSIVNGDNLLKFHFPHNNISHNKHYPCNFQKFMCLKLSHYVVHTIILKPRKISHIVLTVDLSPHRNQYFHNTEIAFLSSSHKKGVTILKREILT